MNDKKDVSPLEEFLMRKRGQLFLKRCIDIIFSGLGLLVTAPLLLSITIAIVVDSPGGVFFRQIRVGKHEHLFKIWKFRTMHPSNSGPEITIGADIRITRLGAFLRRTKLDELPQLFNVLVGEMSLVGPRPEVPRYVAYYTSQQRQIFYMRPGITDPASIYFSDESEMLAKSDDPNMFYIHKVLPQKLALSLDYILNFSFWSDIKIIFQTFIKVFMRN